jgi:hypothetical protein
VTPLSPLLCINDIVLLTTSYIVSLHTIVYVIFSIPCLPKLKLYCFLVTGQFRPLSHS